MWSNPMRIVKSVNGRGHTSLTIAQCPINSGLVNRVTFQWEFFFDATRSPWERTLRGLHTIIYCGKSPLSTSIRAFNVHLMCMIVRMCGAYWRRINTRRKRTTTNIATNIRLCVCMCVATMQSAINMRIYLLYI